MKIKVLKNTKGAKDKLGIQAFDYEAGKTYEIFDQLAKVFVAQGWGVEEKAIENLENKAIDNLENKSIKLNRKVKNNES